MEDKLRKLLIEFRTECKGGKCDTCKLGKGIFICNGTSPHDICSVISLIEQELGIID